MKKLLLLCITTLMISCVGIQYDGEKRLVFQTQVLNADGNPLPNSHVQITVDNTSIISEGKTDQNGRLTLIFPSPIEDLEFHLTIFNDDASYLQKDILNIRETDFEDYKFVFPNAHLVKFDETAPLQLTYYQTGFNTIVSRVGINGIYHMPIEFYNAPTENFYPAPEEILIKKNTTFQLKYTVFNTQTHVETEHIVDLSIGTEPLNYTINY